MYIRRSKRAYRGFGLLGEEELDLIEEQAFRLLEEVGVNVFHQAPRQVLRKAGAKVAEDGLRVHLPRELVREALAQAPNTFSLHNRRGEELPLDQDHVYVGTNGFKLDFRDLDTGEIREPKLTDLMHWAKVADALPNFDVVCPMSVPQDVPRENALALACAATVLNTTKHLETDPQNRQELEYWLEVARLMGYEDLGRERIFAIGAATTSPLQLDPHSAEVIALAADHGIPIHCNVCPPIGAATPFTLAGAISLIHAENLFFIALTQNLRPGLPIMYGTCGTIMDMRAAVVCYGAIEYSLITEATSQLARRCHLPLHITVGGTESGSSDIQAGIEKAIRYLCGITQGANVATGGGVINDNNTLVLEQLVMDDCILGMIARLFQGVDVNEDTLAYSVIASVGPGGSFLSEPHTLKWLRTGEHFYSDIHDRSGYSNPQRIPMLDRARDKVREILSEHQPAIPEDAARRVEAFIEERLRAAG